MDGVALAIVLLMLIAGFVRFHRIGELPLWQNEAYSLWFARQSLVDLWTFVPTFEKHPPLYYTMLKAWLVFGTGEGSLRSLSAVMGIATVPAAYWLGRNLGGASNGRWTGLVTALLVTLAPLQIEYGQEARPYVALTLAFTIALAGLAQLFAHPAAAQRSRFGIGGKEGTTDDDRLARRAWLALIVGTAFTLWLHPIGVLYALALAAPIAPWVAWKLGWNRNFLINSAIAVTLVTVLWSPALPILVLQFDSVSKGFWIEPPTAATIIDSSSALFGLPVLYRFQPWIDVLFACLAVAGICLLAFDRRWPLSILLGCAIAVPIVAELLASYLLQPIFLTRTLIATGVPYYAAIAAALVRTPRPAPRFAATGLLAAILIKACLNYYEIHSKTPWDEIARRVAGLAAPGDIVLIVGNEAELAFDYYYDEFDAPAPSEGIPEPYPAGGAGTVAVTRAYLPALERTLDTHKRIWLLTRRPDIWDPEGLVLETLRREQTQALHEQFGDVELRLFVK